MNKKKLKISKNQKKITKIPRIFLLLNLINHFFIDKFLALIFSVNSKSVAKSNL